MTPAAHTTRELLVMGGTRFMGRAVVEAALARGHRVTIVHRGTHDARFSAPVAEVRGDRSAPETLAALRGQAFDAVVDLSAYGEAQTRALAETLPDVPTFVHVSTGAVYRPLPTFPWREDGPPGPARLWGAYAAAKLGCERALQSLRAGAGQVTWALRLPYVLGPRNYAPREEFVLNRLLDGAELLLPGGGAALVQFVDVTQVGAVAVALAERASEPGFHPLNVATPELTSVAGFVELCAEVSSTVPRTRAVGGGPNGTDETVFDAMNCVFPFPNDPYVLDLARLDALALEIPRVPVRLMIERALEALLADPQRRAWRRTEAEERWL